MTNEEKIKNMSREELAKYLTPFWDCDKCPAQPFCAKDHKDAFSCIEVFAKWLRQEVVK